MFGGFVLTHGAAAAPHRLWHSAGRRLVNGGRFYLAAIARFWLAAMNLPPSYRVARQIDLAIWLVLFVLSKFFLAGQRFVERLQGSGFGSELS